MRPTRTRARATEGWGRAVERRRHMLPEPSSRGGFSTATRLTHTVSKAEVWNERRGGDPFIGPHPAGLGTGPSSAGSVAGLADLAVDFDCTNLFSVMDAVDFVCTGSSVVVLCVKLVGTPSDTYGYRGAGPMGRSARTGRERR